MRKLFFLLTVIATAAACTRLPDKVLSEKKMVDVLTDLYKGEAAIDLSFGKFRTDSSKAVVRDALYEKYGITQEILDSSLAYYGHNINKYVEIHGEVIERLENEQKIIGRAAAGESHIGGDSVNVWGHLSRYAVSGGSPVEYLTFSQSADENWEKGDNYTLQFKIFNRMSPVDYSMFIDYDDGSTDIIKSQADRDGWNRLTISADTARTATNVYGYIHISPQEGETIYLDSLSLVRKRFDNNIYRRRYNQNRFNYGESPFKVYADTPNGKRTPVLRRKPAKTD